MTGLKSAETIGGGGGILGPQAVSFAEIVAILERPLSEIPLYVCMYTYMYSETSLMCTSIVQFPHLPQQY